MAENTLQNVRIVLARADRQVSVLKADLQQRGAEVVELPALSIREEEGWREEVFQGEAPAWTIVTTKGAAERLARVIRQGKGQPEQLGKIAAIGESTATYLEKYGLWPQRSCASDASDTLVEALQSGGIEGEAVQLVGPQNADRMQTLGDALERAGARVTRTGLYHVELFDGAPNALQDVSRKNPDLVVFPSLNTITHFVALVQECEVPAWLSLPAAAIGATTARAATEHGFQVVAQPKMNTMQALVDAIEAWHTVH